MTRTRRGYTMLEALSVFVVITILSAVAWWYVAGPVERNIVDDQARQSLLQATTSLELHYDSRGYMPASAAAAALIEPDLTWVDAEAAADTAGEISLGSTADLTGEILVLATPTLERCLTMRITVADTGRTEERGSYGYDPSRPVCSAALAYHNPGGPW